MAIIPVQDYNPPIFHGQVTFSGGDSGNTKFIVATNYIIEQWVNTLTGQVWFHHRATTNVNDGIVPIHDLGFKTQYKQFGSTNFKRILIGNFGTSDALMNAVNNLRGTISVSSKNTTSFNNKLTPVILKPIKDYAAPPTILSRNGASF